uniref:Putative RNA exonuclease NEF-sp n=1 Tax=Anthurium amnicola TaxID=1678845 RepID=A0A1D1YWJ5_9ARAE
MALREGTEIGPRRRRRRRARGDTWACAGVVGSTWDVDEKDEGGVGLDGVEGEVLRRVGYLEPVFQLHAPRLPVLPAFPGPAPQERNGLPVLSSAMGVPFLRGAEDCGAQSEKEKKDCVR